MLTVQRDPRPMTYLLRDIDPALWRLVKIRAATEGRSVRDVLLELLRRYTEPRQTVDLGGTIINGP